MAQYMFGDVEVSSNDVVAFQKALDLAYKAEVRPRCLCHGAESGDKSNAGIPMCIVNLDRYILRRWPKSAREHTRSCVSSELPVEMTGYGALLLGKAIELLPNEHTSLKLNYILSEGADREPGGKTGVGASEGAKESETDNKLSIRATLHLLYQESGLHKWAGVSPETRDWKMISSGLRMAAVKKDTKGFDLAKLLFVPESFGHETEKSGIAGAMAKLASRHKSKQKPLLLLVAEYKDIRNYDDHASVPQYPFLMEEDGAEDFAFSKNFKMHPGTFSTIYKDEINLLRVHKGYHLMAIATFNFGEDSLVTLNKAAVMLVNENWLPCQDEHEKRIIDELTATNRRFEVTLRFNQRLDFARPFLTIKDAETPTLCYIVPAGAKQEYWDQRKKQILDSSYGIWEWDPSSDKGYPPFPISIEQ